MCYIKILIIAQSSIKLVINYTVQYYIMKYRGREEIFASILQSAATDNGIIRTKIMYNSFLFFLQLRSYLEPLIDNELLTYERPNKVYKITKKGFEFLEIYNKMSDLLTTNETETHAIPSSKKII
jgi:predicted transcriptional regulator